MSGIPASASPRSSTNCTRSLFRRAGFSHQANSTSTSATFPMRPWRKPSRADPPDPGQERSRAQQVARSFWRRSGPNGGSSWTSFRNWNSSSANSRPSLNYRRRRQRRFQLVLRRFIGVFARPNIRSRCFSTICNGSTPPRSICSRIFSPSRRLDISADWRLSRQRSRRISSADA